MPDTITINLPLPTANWRAQTLLPYCRALVDAGADPASIVRVMRGDTLCFVPAALSVFAGLSVRENDHTSARFVPYAPMPEDLRAK